MWNLMRWTAAGALMTAAVAACGQLQPPGPGYPEAARPHRRNTYLRRLSERCLVKTVRAIVRPAGFRAVRVRPLQVAEAAPGVPSHAGSPPPSR